ncbi:hypothetical protein P3X46_028630 [Hevea brasiliensis]|uniref:Uncharacterized protein n=1 Tax=Hevea brasiliensis TaxID=3981 RepID=A0ABQ9KPL6_HEVBR|nr:uncharacterized protein LOC110665598 isoform X1 [Hevea brasiliensis]KAJ9146351.1 hypothetical protein P3X46_028630 [Hevea brasiliensis]
MAKPEARSAGIHLRNKITRARTNSNRVIISLYVESPRKCSHQKTGDLNNKAKQNLLFRRPQSTKTKCYDRRAELLAYARELRDSAACHQQERWPRRISSRLKSEKLKWSSAPVRIQASIQKIFRRNEKQYRYEKIVSEQNSGVFREFHSRKKKTPRGNIASTFCKKLKRMLKELSCGLTCSKR